MNAILCLYWIYFVNWTVDILCVLSDTAAGMRTLLGVIFFRNVFGQTANVLSHSLLEKYFKLHNVNPMC